MRTVRLRNFISRFTAFCIILLLLTGCKTSKLIEYSSLADHEQKASGLRTEMLIINGDDQNIKRNYFAVSAVDYLPDGKKNYYLIMAFSGSPDSSPKLDDLLLQYDYPYIIQGRNLPDLVSSLEKCTAEWDSTDMKYSGAVYNYFISSPQYPRLLIIDNRSFEIVPYIKLNYSKTENGAIAKLALGSRMEEVVVSVVDGKTVKTRMFIRDDENFWIFDSSDKMKDFRNIIAKGLLDLRTKGMDGYSKKTESKAEKTDEEKASADKKSKSLKKTRRVKK